MTRLVLCILILGGTVAFLSCSDSLDPDGGTGKGGDGGAGRGGSGGGCPPGYACDGAAPIGGTTGTDGTGAPGGRGGTGCLTCDGAGPTGGRGGIGGGSRGGFIGSDGIGPVGGRGGTTGVGGRGGCGGACDGAGPVAGRGGTNGTGGTGSLGPCAGLAYFQQREWCAMTYAAQVAKQVPGNCDYVRVLAGTCGGMQVWATRYTSVGDPIVCAYSSAGFLAGARICTDAPMPAWNCNGEATAPNCLIAGTVPDIQACTMATTCGGTGGRGGAGGFSGSGGCVTGCDGTGPVSGRGGG